MFADLLNFRGEGSPQASHSIERAARPGKRRWARLPIACVVGLASISLSGCFRVSSDVGALRDSVMKTVSAKH